MSIDIYKRPKYVIFTDGSHGADLLVNFRLKHQDLNGDNVTIDISDTHRSLARDLLGVSSPDAQVGIVAALHDNAAVGDFALKMIDKLAAKRADGYGGWQEAGVEHLCKLLYNHLEKGDMVDIGNFAMMLAERDAGGATPESRRKTIATVFEELIASNVILSPAYQELLRNHKELARKLSDSETERERLATYVRKLEGQVASLQKDVEKERERARNDHDIHQANLAIARENLARALGYIDRVNEGTGRPPGNPNLTGPVLNERQKIEHRSMYDKFHPNFDEAQRGY